MSQIINIGQTRTETTLRNIREIMARERIPFVMVAILSDALNPAVASMAITTDLPPSVAAQGLRAALQPTAQTGQLLQEIVSGVAHRVMKSAGLTFEALHAADPEAPATCADFDAFIHQLVVQVLPQLHASLAIPQTPTTQAPATSSIIQG